MALAPTMMVRFITIFLSGEFVAKPADVSDWTQEVFALTAEYSAQVNLLELPMLRWYTRCDCKPADDGTMDNSNLVDAKGGKCTHHILGSHLMANLKATQGTDRDTLYKNVKGKGRSDAPIYKMLEGVKMGGVRLFTQGKDNHIFGLVVKPSNRGAGAGSAAAPLSPTPGYARRVGTAEGDAVAAGRSFP